jgi:hypothetical protein
MVYLTHYVDYPIYEPAEGGYYYSGREVAETERLSLRQAKRKLKQITEEAMKETPCDWKLMTNHRRYGYLNPGKALIRDSEYIGEGERYVIERTQGSLTTGRTPYC